MVHPLLKPRVIRLDCVNLLLSMYVGRVYKVIELYKLYMFVK
jgi:hypothetical protein